jgi:hypothetical protein
LHGTASGLSGTPQQVQARSPQQPPTAEQVTYDIKMFATHFHGQKRMRKKKREGGGVLLTFPSMIIFFLQNIRTEINPVLTPRAAGTEGSLIGIQGNSHILCSLDSLFSG